MMKISKKYITSLLLITTSMLVSMDKKPNTSDPLKDFDAFGTADIIKVIHKGDKDLLKACLMMHETLDDAVVYAAVYKGDPEILQILLNTKKVELNELAAIIAVDKEDIEMLQTLLQAQAPLNINILSQALAKKKNEKMCKMLIDAKAPLTHYVVADALKTGNKNISKMLLDAHAPISSGAFQYVIEKKDTESMQKLFDADIQDLLKNLENNNKHNLKNILNSTIAALDALYCKTSKDTLSDEIKQNQQKYTQWLAQQPTTQIPNTIWALIWSAENGHIEAVKILVSLQTKILDQVIKNNDQEITNLFAKSHMLTYEAALLNMVPSILNMKQKDKELRDISTLLLDVKKKILVKAPEKTAPTKK